MQTLNFMCDSVQKIINDSKSIVDVGMFSEIWNTQCKENQIQL
jgi:hypothetical protein